MKTEQAIKYFEREIRFCERAPALNGCEMTDDWLLTLEVSKLAVAALREQQERQNHEPLTIEDLRSMIGEPVWVKIKASGRGFWVIVDNAWLGMTSGFTAYRSKPEEVCRNG